MKVNWHDVGCPDGPGSYPFKDGTITVRQQEIDVWIDRPDARFTVRGFRHRTPRTCGGAPLTLSTRFCAGQNRAKFRSNSRPSSIWLSICKRQDCSVSKCRLMRERPDALFVGPDPFFRRPRARRTAL
jgi:hypothetical protein